MIDPKRVELTLYNKIPHLLTPVITDPKKAILALKWAAKEMSRRYDLLEKSATRDIESYHKNILSPALEKYKALVKDMDDDDKKPPATDVLNKTADKEKKRNEPPTVNANVTVEDKKKLTIENKLSVNGRELALAGKRHEMEINERAGFKNSPYQRRIAVEQGATPSRK